MKNKMVSIVSTTLAVVMLLTMAVGCASSGVSQEEYDQVVAERDAAKAQVSSLEDDLAATQAEAARLEEELAAAEAATQVPAPTPIPTVEATQEPAPTPIPTVEDTPAPAPTTITVVDQLGREVLVPKEPSRVVMLPIPFHAVFYAVAESGESIVGMHPTSMIHLENSILSVMAPEMMTASTDFVTSGFEVNIEELLKLEPDVVFQWAWMDDEIEKMERVGIPVIAVEYGTQQDLAGWIEIIGQVMGKEDRAAEILAYHNETIGMISERTVEIPVEDRPKSICLYNVKELQLTGTDTYNQWWTETAGGVNPAEVESGFYNVDMEQILDWDPDVIFITNFCETRPEDLLENKIEGQDWSQVNAVKNGRVYKIPMGEYRWAPPSVESHLMLKWLAQIQQPDLFADYEMEEEIIEFYSTFYGYQLSDMEVYKILNPRSLTPWEDW
jgi:iron complex transport system substrate-binding protein